MLLVYLRVLYIRIRLLALSLLVLLPLACSGAPTLGSPPPASTPDIEATVRAAVQAALPTPAPSDPPDLAATVIVSVRATVEAMLAATPVPAPVPVEVPTATATSIPVPTPVAVAIAAPAAMLTKSAEPAPSLAPAPTPVPAPTARPTPRPTPVPVSRFVGVPSLAPTLTPEPTATPSPVPTPAAPLLEPGGCQPAAEGALVTAWVEGAWAASTTVQDGSYVLFVDQGGGGSYIGKTVNFKIGDLDANETGIWEIGGGDGINLTAALRPAPDPSASLHQVHLRGGLLAQAVPPHVFVGTAFVCGSATPAPTPLPPGGCQPAADGALVAAWVGESLVASSTVQDGRYILFIDQGAGEAFSGKTVTFKIGDLDANETGIWEAGGGNDLDLTSAPWHMPEPTPAPYALLPRESIGSGVLAQPVPPHVFLGKASICG